MKKIFLPLMLLASVSVYSQERTPLSNFFKVEAFLDKINLGYEQPINENLLLDINAGIGGANIIRPGEIAYKLGKDDGLITVVFL